MRPKSQRQSEQEHVSSTAGTVSNSDSGTHQVKCVRSGKESGTAPQCKDPVQILDFPDSLMISYDDETVIFWYFGNPKVTKTWEEALEYCKTRNIHGLSKMRLPTVNELVSLINSADGTPRIPGFSDKAWTSTTANGNAAKAYAVDFTNAELTLDDKDTNNYYVICVE